MGDLTQQLQAQIAAAHEAGTALAIRGHGSKAFYGGLVAGESVEVALHSGIIQYEPRELVITARAGTPLSELEATLAEAGQMLPFEPPRFASAGTLGGAVAAGLSGPRRPYCGAVRDFVLGVRLINGRGEVLHFGGEVIKNVAGYDVARVMAGALGTLGLLLEISLKVLPRPQREITLCRACSPREAVALFNQWAGQPLPISAACHVDGQLKVRLSGAPEAVQAARERLGGDAEEETTFWSQLRDHRLAFFDGERPLWRLSLPADAPFEPVDGHTLVDWGGAQRWLRSDVPAHEVRAAAVAMGGHAHRFRGGDRGDAFHPLPEPLMKLHRNLKAAFDPKGILNAGRLYPTL